MKKSIQLQAAFIAFILSLFFMHFAHGQGDMFGNQFNSAELIESDPMTPYATIYGSVINSDIKRNKVQIQVFQLDDSTCTWHKIEEYRDNEFLFVFERDKEYQVYFFDGTKYKILYIDPGYLGNYAYEINANFISTRCARMTPDEFHSYKQYDVNYVNHSDIKSLEYQKRE